MGEIREQVIGMVKDYSPLTKPDIKNETLLEKDLEITPLALVELMCELEDEFDFEFEAVLKDIKTVEDVVDIVLEAEVNRE